MSWQSLRGSVFDVGRDAGADRARAPRRSGRGPSSRSRSRIRRRRTRRGNRPRRCRCVRWGACRWGDSPSAHRPRRPCVRWCRRRRRHRSCRRCRPAGGAHVPRAAIGRRLSEGAAAAPRRQRCAHAERGNREHQRPRSGPPSSRHETRLGEVSRRTEIGSAGRARRPSGHSPSAGGCGPGTIPAISGSSSGLFGSRSAFERSRSSRRSAFFFCFSLRASSFFRFSKGFGRGRMISAYCASRRAAPHHQIVELRARSGVTFEQLEVTL